MANAPGRIWRKLDWRTEPQVFGGDFRTDPLPKGADIVSLVRVIHDHDDEAALAILNAAWKALPEGGTLLLAEPMAGTAGRRGRGGLFRLLFAGDGQRTAAARRDADEHASYRRVHPRAAAADPAANAGARPGGVKMSCHSSA